MTFQRFSIEDVPEFQEFQEINPQNPSIDSLQAMIMYGRAIHWVGIFDIIWPDFDKIDKYLTIEVGYIVANDPDKDNLPDSFFEYIANMITMFWELQLKQKYPHGNWTITIEDDPDRMIEVEIISRG